MSPHCRCLGSTVERRPIPLGTGSHKYRPRPSMTDVPVCTGGLALYTRVLFNLLTTLFDALRSKSSPPHVKLSSYAGSETPVQERRRYRISQSPRAASAKCSYEGMSLVGAKSG